MNKSIYLVLVKGQCFWPYFYPYEAKVILEFPGESSNLGLLFEHVFGSLRAYLSGLPVWPSGNEGILEVNLAPK